MKKKIESKKIISILLIAFLMFATNVYAANSSFQTTLTANKTQVKVGDTVTITMGLSDIAIESGEKGIGGYSGHITFDSSVLEYVSKSGTDKWETPTYNSGVITATTEDGEVVNTPQSIGTITFKVKADAKVGETTIGLENFSGTDGENDIPTGNKSITLTVVGNSTGDGNGSGSIGTGAGTNNNGESGNNGGNGQGTSGNRGNTVDTRKENTVKGVLPKAGSANITIFGTIGVCILIIMVLYIRFKVLDRKMKNNK